MGRLLAIDYGLKRTGLAVTDPEQRIATGLAAVETPLLEDYLKAYLRDNEVETIVVGEPRRWDNTPSGPVAELSGLTDRLNELFGLPVVRVDERFTSRIAARSLVEAGVPKSKRRNKGLVDTVSAVLILQSFLERRRNGGTS